MIDRRTLIAGAGAACTAPAAVFSGAVQDAPQPMTARVRRRFRPREVDVNPVLDAGELIVKQSDFHIYWTLGNGRALRYGIALGDQGRNFEGVATIARKAEWPGWRPTRSMIEVEPELYGPYAAGLPGGHPMNPMGAAALYMYQGGRDTFYRVHGTPFPWTIGQGYSSGCIKMRNADMLDLYARVPVGTRITIQA